MPIFLLDEAASATASGLGGGISPFLSIGLIAVMILVFWLLVIRPQKKQEKEAAQLRDSIKVGDEVITIGGIVGRVIFVRDDKIMIETGNDKTKITILKSAVKTVEPEETEEK